MLSIKQVVRYATDHSGTLSPKIPDVLNRVLAHRNITDIQQITYTLNQLLPCDGLLGMKQAVDLLTAALEKQQHILILGDFDADGATSTALAVSALKAFGAKQVSYLVPNRFDYGYGLTPEIVEVAAARRPNLLITVDNGIASCDGVLAAKAHGISVIITDHHLPGDTLPQADAIVNPNQPGDSFASKTLAGVGVIFYVMWALRNALHAKGWFTLQRIMPPKLADFLDLVALGTVADLAPLDYNNRILVQQGLGRIRIGQSRPGIDALLELAKRNPSRLIASDLGFALGPRLNAAGRLDDMSLGIECLLTNNRQKAREIANQLDKLNQERRFIENDMQQQAQTLLSLIPDTQSANGICLYHKDFHQGVIGILASRVKDKLHRPSIVFANGNEVGVLKGSARSVVGLHMRDTLDAIASQNPLLISKFGGHAQAAGLQIATADFERFSEVFDQAVGQQLSSHQLTGQIMSDGELCEDEFSVQLAYLIRETTPWGQQFPEPLFDGHFKIRDQRLVGEKHLKLVLSTTLNEKPLHAIAFNVDLAQWPNLNCDSIHAAYRLDINEYQGQQQLQLIIEQLEPIE